MLMGIQLAEIEQQAVWHDQQYHYPEIWDQAILKVLECDHKEGKTAIKD